MAAALEHALHGRGIPALGIWAQVPHYVASMAYPAASVALLDGLTDVDRHHRRRPPTCARDVAIQRERLDQLVDGNADHLAMVAPARAALRRRRGRDGDAGADDATARRRRGRLELRSGDELAAEIERFLHDQGKG